MFIISISHQSRSIHWDKYINYTKHVRFFEDVISISTKLFIVFNNHRYNIITFQSIFWTNYMLLLYIVKYIPFGMCASKTIYTTFLNDTLGNLAVNVSLILFLSYLKKSIKLVICYENIVQIVVLVFMHNVHFISQIDGNIWVSSFVKIELSGLRATKTNCWCVRYLYLRKWTKSNVKSN